MRSSPHLIDRPWITGPKANVGFFSSHQGSQIREAQGELYLAPPSSSFDDQTTNRNLSPS